MANKRTAATLVTFLLFAASAATYPVQAHFTLGDLTGTPPFQTFDFDPHVAGVIGYVWPGAGQCAWNGYPNLASDNCSPGYQAPYPNGNPPGAPNNSWYQLEGNTYSPFGAVLTGSTGDLIFALNATKGFTGRWESLAILLPPGFNVPGSPQIVSTITNDYTGISVQKIGPYDRYAPGWTIVEVLSDAGRDATAPFGAPYYDHQAIDFTSAGEWYYIRINGVTAPSIAGRYFFKILLYGDTPSICGEEGTGTGGGPLPGEDCSQFIPTQNWPVLLVKGEVDPAIITGTLRYAGYNTTLYEQPIAEAGRVWAHMTLRLDPYTGLQRPDLPAIDGQAYLNATANGHYELEGLAAGVYDIYVEAAGYPQTLCESGITVLRAQSLHFDCYLQPGPVIHGNVFSKHQFGDEPWPENSYVKIELYDGPTLNHVPEPSANLVSWSPLPCVAGGQDLYTAGDDAGACGDPRDGSALAFPWHEYSTVRAAAYDDPSTLFTGAENGYMNDVSESSTFGNGLLTSDPMGVGPPQKWYVAGGTTNPFHFEFGAKGEYGAPRDLDGMVPQVYATWVNGLTPGRYYVRAWVFRYAQSALDGTTFQEYYFDVTPNEWAGDVTLPIDLRLSSWVNKTVYFHDTPGTISTGPIDTGAGDMSGVLVDANGVVWSYNQTLLGYKGLYSFGSRSGWGPNAFFTSTTVRNRNDLDKAKLNAHAIETGRANIQLWGWNDTWDGENYGIPAGTYTTHVFALGYIESGPADEVSVTLSGNPTSISDHLYRGAGFNLTVYSIDWEQPSVGRDWVWGNPVGYILNGLATIGSGPSFPGDPRSQMVGEEIDIGIYNATNSRLVDFIGDKISTLATTSLTTCLFQSQVNASIQMCGGGWEPQYLTPAGAYTTYLDNANDVYFGQEMSLGIVGGVAYSTMYFSTYAPTFPAHYYPTTLPDGSVYSSAVTGFQPLYPSAIQPGEYDFRGYTYGYIQDSQSQVYAAPSQVADIKINLIIGVNVTLNILFKKENIITPTPYNMSARVRLFNDQDQLVAEWMSSEGTYVTGNEIARAADGTNQYPFGPLHPAVPVPEPLNTHNYLPGGVTLLTVLTAGLPQVPAGGTDSGTSSAGVPERAYLNDPLYATTTCGFQLNCYRTPGLGLGVGVPGYFPNTGIPGAPDYTGGWTAEVDFVPWYTNNTATTTWTTLPFQFGGTVIVNGAQYFPPVIGLLMGESYHIIPGTTATSGVSLTEDTALKLIGHSMAANHLGPYSQEGVWQIAGTHNSGEASGIFEVDLNGFISGQVLGFTWANEFRTQSWDTISVTGASGATLPSMYTFDGLYQGFFAPDQYSFTINAPGYTPQTWSISITPGETGTGQNVYLQQNQIPVPEFSAVAVVAFSALAASLYVLRRRRK